METQIFHSMQKYNPLILRMEDFEYYTPIWALLYSKPRALFLALENLKFLKHILNVFFNFKFPKKN
jgi:hypothetical protein